jgi:hypothetical protein
MRISQCLVLSILKFTDALDSRAPRHQEKKPGVLQALLLLTASQVFTPLSLKPLFSVPKHTCHPSSVESLPFRLGGWEGRDPH